MLPIMTIKTPVWSNNTLTGNLGPLAAPLVTICNCSMKWKLTFYLDSSFPFPQPSGCMIGTPTVPQGMAAINNVDHTDWLYSKLSP